MLILSINFARFVIWIFLAFMHINERGYSVHETYIFTVIMYTKEIVSLLFLAVTLVIWRLFEFFFWIVVHVFSLVK